MVKLRYLGAPHFLRLQYRTLRPTWLASGAWGEPSEWSEWQGVPVAIAAEDIAGEKAGLTQPREARTLPSLLPPGGEQTAPGKPE